MNVDKRAVAVMGLGALGASAVVAYSLTKPAQTTPVLTTPPPVILQCPTPVTPVAVPTSTDNLPNKMPLTQTPLVTVLVPAGSEVNVYHVNVPRSYAGVITDIGNTMYTPVDANGNQLFYIDFTIDGDLVERVKRIIANPNSPLMLAQPYLATDNINWRAHNGTQQDMTVEVYCNGFMQRRADS